nr:immunoglobulin heavy chain junction region [Mus musculus]
CARMTAYYYGSSWSYAMDYW